MNWIMLVMAFFLPIVQPVVQQGMQNVQARVQQRVQQQQPATQPYVVYHNGAWWKYEGGQWYVWRPNGV